MGKILLVKPRHIGDSLLLTPSIRAIRENYPSSTVWVVVRKSCEGILSGCPDVDRVFTTVTPEAGRRNCFSWIEDVILLCKIRRQRFDLAVDLGESKRGRWLVALSGARKKVSSYSSGPISRFWKYIFDEIIDFTGFNEHQVEKDFMLVSKCLRLGKQIGPLVFEPSMMTHCPTVDVNKVDYAVVHTGTRWKRKRWSDEKWVELCRCLSQRHALIVVSSGKDEQELKFAIRLKALIGDKVVLTEGNFNWSQNAYLLYHAKAYIGVDTAMTHLAAACQCPAVVLFGGSPANSWYPWKSANRVVLPRRAGQTTSEIEVSDVISAYNSIIVEK